MNVFDTRMSDFPFGHLGWHTVSELFDSLYILMSDTPLPVISFDTDHNTRLRITEADELEPGNPSQNFLKEIRFKVFFGDLYIKKILVYQY